MLQVLLLHVLEEVPEHVMIIYYQFVYYSSMDVLWWELILVPFLYHLGHLGEVPWYRRSVVVDDQVVVADHILQKVCVVR